MEKIDRLGWAAGLAFISHGARIGIRVTEAAVLERLPVLLPPGSAAASSPVVHDLYSLIVGTNGQGAGIKRFSLLYSGSAQLARTMDHREVYDVLREHLHVLVSLRAPRRLFLRGSAVGWGDAAVVIPSDRPTDASALLSALMNAGATCYSDRYIVLDERGRVHPYRVPVLNADTGGDHEAAIERSGEVDARRPLPVRLIAFAASEAGSLSESRVLPPAQAVVALLRHAVASRLRPAYAIKTLERAASTATALELPDCSPDAALAPLFDRLRASATALRV